jgi:RNA polymerase sigma-70 factor, ECF subfamily
LLAIFTSGAPHRCGSTLAQRALIVIRVTVNQESPNLAMVHVEGKLSGSSATELMASCCRQLQSQGFTLKLDLTDLTFIDQGGKMFLQEILDGQNQLAGCSDFVQMILNNAESQSAKPQLSREDAALIDGLRRGDDEAFEQLVRKFGARMLATARRILGSEDDARDALQEAFLCAFKSSAHFKGDSALSTWLHRIVINSALMQLRYRKRHPEEQMDGLLPQFDQNANWINGHDASVLPDNALETIETRAMVRRCVELVPPSHRIVLLLRDIEQLSTEEVAMLLGISTNAVKIRLHRARQALKTLIERDSGTRLNHLQSASKLTKSPARTRLQ